jgi:hypothetical protein
VFVVLQLFWLRFSDRIQNSFASLTMGTPREPWTNLDWELSRWPDDELRRRRELLMSEGISSRLRFAHESERFLAVYLEVDDSFPHLLTEFARDVYEDEGWVLHVSVAYSTDAPDMRERWRELRERWSGWCYTIWPRYINPRSCVATLRANNSLMRDLGALHEIGSLKDRPLHVSL